jgi:TPR repeat protein
MKNHRKRWYIGIVVVLAAVVGGLYTFSSNCCSEELTAAELASLHEMAERGNVDAMLELFAFHENRDESAISQAWLERAAKTGSSDADMFLYHRLISKRDPSSKRLATKHLMSAAERGKPSAQELLGSSYKEGKSGLPKNLERAKYWLRKSALAGDPDGVLELCNLALVERDRTQCAECLSLTTRAMSGVKQDSYLGKNIDLLRRRLARELGDGSVY